MPERKFKTRWTGFDEDEDAFDFEFWSELGDQAIWDTAWELVELYWRQIGRDPSELRLQRSVARFQPLPR